MRTDIARWRLLGVSAILLIVLALLRHAAANAPWLTIGVVLAATGVLLAARALWPEPGARLSDWAASPASVETVRGVYTGLAVFMLGFACISMSLIDLESARWDVTALVGALTLGAYMGS